MNVVFSFIMCCACVSTAVGSSSSDDSNPVCDPYSNQGGVGLVVPKPSGTPKQNREVVIGEKSWPNSDEPKHPSIENPGNSSDSSPVSDSKGRSGFTLSQQLEIKGDDQVTGDVWKKGKPTYTVNEEGIHEIAFPETIFSKYDNDVVSLRPIKIQIDSKVANWERFREQTEQLKEALSDDTPTRVLALADAMRFDAVANVTYNGRKDLLSTCKELNKLQEYLRLLSLRGAKDDLGESYYRLFCRLSCICSEFVVFNNKAVLPENLYIAALYVELGSKKPEEYSCLEKYDPSNKNIIKEINRNGGIDSSDSTSFLAWGIKKALEDKVTFGLLPKILKNKLRPS